MGRPLKKSFFGSPATGGKQLVLSYVCLDGVITETGYWIIRQVGTARYQVTNGTTTGVVKLVDAMPNEAGEGVIEVYPFGGQVEYASKIHNRTVVTFDGNTYAWSIDDADEEGKADLNFETWAEGPPSGTIMTAGGSEGGVGFFGGSDAGSIVNPEIDDFTIYQLYQNESGWITVGFDGDFLPGSITVTIEGDEYEFVYWTTLEGAIQYIYGGNLGFEVDHTYRITEIVAGEEYVEPEDETIFYIDAEQWGGGSGPSATPIQIGYAQSTGGSIEGQPEGYTIIGFYEDGISRLYIAGDHPEIGSIEITGGGTTITYGYNGSEGATEFLSEESFGFVGGNSYEFTGFHVNLIP